LFKKIIIDHDIAISMANILRKNLDQLEKIDVFDQRFFPPKEMDREKVGMYFLVMVAIDHRLSRPGKPYEACIEDGCYHGADLLWRLGKQILDEYPDFYTAFNLSKIRIDDIKKYFNINNAEVPDPDIRAYLLRDLGLKLDKLYSGRFLELLKASNNRIRGRGTEHGLIDLLRVFRAYEDPVEKKSFLLIKFLQARGLFTAIDQHNMEVPVDNHLSRIAYRTGLVQIRGKLWDYIRSFHEVSYSDDIILRFTVRYAYSLVADLAGINKGILDDILWIHGRRICLRDKHANCNSCSFNIFCKAYMNQEYMVREHNYYNTWYY